MILRNIRKEIISQVTYEINYLLSIYVRGQPQRDVDEKTYQILQRTLYYPICMLISNQIWSQIKTRNE